MRTRRSPEPPGRTAAERGQVLVLVALLLLGVVAVIGLATDGGLVFAQRRDLQNLADGAALAGAMQLDEAAYRTGGIAMLDAGAARRAALEYLAGEPDLSATVQVEDGSVVVEVRRQAETGFLRVIGIDGVTISASGRAIPRPGITRGPP